MLFTFKKDVSKRLIITVCPIKPLKTKPQPGKRVLCVCYLFKMLIINNIGNLINKLVKEIKFWQN